MRTAYADGYHAGVEDERAAIIARLYRITHTMESGSETDRRQHAG